LAGHVGFAGDDFVENDLGSEKVVLGALKVPSILGELLAGGLSKVPGQARDNVARHGAFNVNPHDRSLRPVLADGSKNVGACRGAPSAAILPKTASAQKKVNFILELELQHDSVQYMRRVRRRPGHGGEAGAVFFEILGGGVKTMDNGQWGKGQMGGDERLIPSSPGRPLRVDGLVAASRSSPA
jgi:hypothetical protein